ncbi:Hypothetical predicted protein [Mytilus galloprovincialis]|uniref:Uncharacterized protein n=1 Tax=Mytilus galloprovincialis TaxID=29158 RepID=A0A8B6GLL4_MYTGA|nr:Hypothetical predicted protein [Mytilus galloprovincialis]
MKNIKSDREIEERCSEFMKKIEDRITSLESEMKTKVNPEQVKEILETVIGTDKLPDVRKRADTLVVSQLVNYLETDAEGIKNVVRIGKREENAEKPRPMKVTLENVDIKKKLMKNLTKLKAVDKESKFGNISVTHDMTKTEREQNKAKLTEAKQKNENDKSGKHLYIVRGPPWARKIIRVPKEIEQCK